MVASLICHGTIKPRLHNTTGLTTGLTTMLNEQTVRSTRLSNRLYNLVWQPCWTNSHCSFNRLSNPIVQPDWQPTVYTIQPFVKPVVKPVWQLVECLYTRYNRLLNRFDNRLNVCIHDTTGCHLVWQQVVSCKWGLTNNGDLVQVLLWKGSAEETNSIDGKNFWN